jgi:tyrosyl-tRNA synthetase
VHYNSKWLKKLNFKQVCELADVFTVQQMLERRNFSERFKNHQDISLREFLYPIMQGYDSVAISADVELGGEDQLFNLHAGRKIQEFLGQKPQNILTTKMLSGLDGRKMSTSWGNVINITDTAYEQFGKIMSMHDEMIPEYLELTTDLDDAEIHNLISELKNNKINPKEVKKIIGFNIVKRYWGEDEAKKAKEKFEILFEKKEVAKDLPVLKLKNKKINIVDLILLTGALKSKSEAKRLIGQGGFKINNEQIKDIKKELVLEGGEIIKIGKHKFFKIK